MNVVVNGLMTSYQKAGKGKTLVFLPGWGDNKATFSGLIGLLKENYEIYALDLPGFGGSQIPQEIWGLQDYADFVRDWIVKLKIKPVALVGHSYGGAVAIVLASQSDIPELILLGSAGIRGKNRLRKKALSAAAKAGKVPLYLLPAPSRRRVKEKLYHRLGSDLMLLPHMEQTFRKIINEDVRARAARVNARTLLIYGSGDTSTPVSDGRLLAGLISGSKLEVIEAGHFLHQEQPEQVAGLMRGFLEGQKNV